MMKLRNVVNTRNHGYVAIDTCYTFDHGFETMVFKCDKNGNIIDWSDLDVDMYDNAEKAEEGHKEMIENGKQIKEENNGQSKTKIRKSLYPHKRRIHPEYYHRCSGRSRI